MGSDLSPSTTAKASHCGLPDLSLFQGVPSPTLVFFPEIIAQNIQEILRRVGNDPRRLRPHCKTHKCSHVIRMLLNAGVEKHKCATLAEAAMLVKAGAKDVLISYPLVGPNLTLLKRMVADHPTVKFSFLVDEPRILDDLAKIFGGSAGKPGLFIDLDGGMGRTGIDVVTEPGRAKIGALAATIQKHGFTLQGIQLYDGHVNQEKATDRLDAAKNLWEKVEGLKKELHGWNPAESEVVVGGSPSFMVHTGLDWQGVTHSPGTVILHDRGYGSKYQDMAPFQWGAAVLTRAISKPIPGRMTLDLGHKAIAADPPMEKRAYFPGIPDAKPILQNEEHLVLETGLADQVRVGELFWAIPWHICPTVALHEKALVFEQGQLKSWWTIDARTRFTGYEDPS